MSVSLVMCSDKSHIFDDNKNLLNIWNSEMTEYAIEATRDWENGIDIDGEIYGITLNDKIIGITGWFDISESEAVLRWHGITQAHRGNGNSRTALELLYSRLKYLKYSTIYEVAFSTTATEYFIKIGFGVVECEKLKDRVITEAGGGNIVLQYKLI